MKSEKDIINEITELEKKLFDDECYLDEQEHGELQALYSILDRELTPIEKENIIKEREKEMIECIGEIIPDLINRDF